MIARAQLPAYNSQTRVQSGRHSRGCNELEAPLFLLAEPLGRVSQLLSLGAASSGLDEGRTVHKPGSAALQTPGGLPTMWVALPPQPGEAWVQFLITTLYPLVQPFSIFVVGKTYFSTFTW